MSLQEFNKIRKAYIDSIDLLQSEIDKRGVSIGKNKKEKRQKEVKEDIYTEEEKFNDLLWAQNDYFTKQETLIKQSYANGLIDKAQ